MPYVIFLIEPERTAHNGGLLCGGGAGAHLRGVIFIFFLYERVPLRVNA